MHIVSATRDMPKAVDTVLTAGASAEQLREILSRMVRAEAFATPGPARVATIQLSTGHRVSLVFHERKNFVEILAPIESGIEAGLAEILAELRIPPAAITWTHERIDRQALFARLNAATATV